MGLGGAHNKVVFGNNADTVGDLGYAEELGNYAEYSGAPNTQVQKRISCKLSCQMSNPFMPSADVVDSC